MLKTERVGSVEVAECLGFLIKDYNVAVRDAAAIGELLSQKATVNQLELPRRSPWRELENLETLRAGALILDQGEDARRHDPVLAELLIEIVNDALPIDPDASARFHIAFSALAIQILANLDHTEDDDIIDWVHMWISSGYTEYFAPSLAGLLNAARFSALEPADPELNTSIDRAAESNPGLWLTPSVYMDWAKRETRSRALLERLDSLDALPPDCIERLFQSLLEDDVEQSLRTEMIPRLLGLADLQLARAILGQLSGDEHKVMVPGLVIAGIRAQKTTTQLAALNACVRIGSPIAEPLIIELLRNGGPGMQHRASQAAGELGTRLCLEHLLSLEEHAGGSLEAVASEAILAIASRYPASDYADVGSLTLDEGSAARGALSLALADEGSLTLYEEAMSAANRATSSKAPGAHASTSHSSSIYRLDVPPRRLGFDLYSACFYRKNLWGQISLALILILIITMRVAPVLPAYLILFGLAAISIVFGVSKSLETTKILKQGLPAYATHTRFENQWIKNDGRRELASIHQYFEYVTEAGDVVEQYRRIIDTSRRDEILEYFGSMGEVPVLYLPEREPGARALAENVLFLHEHRQLTVDEDGNLSGAAAGKQLYTLVALAHGFFVLVSIWSGSQFL